MGNPPARSRHSSLNVGILQYRARHDKHCKSYFSSNKALPKITSSLDSYDVYCDDKQVIVGSDQVKRSLSSLLLALFGGPVV